MRRTISWFVALSLLAFAAVLPAHADAARGATVSGTVLDTSGAPVPDADVLLRGEDGAVQRTARTDSSGGFRISALPPGRYRLIVSKPDFATWEMPVSVGSAEAQPLLRIRLTVNPVNTTISVESRADDLIGIADSATQGTIGAKEIEDRPILRTGEILEAVPGIIITQHAGGGKANQYFLRGFNLDHGTDFAIFIDDMPLNLPSHAHGEGYSDMNVVIPEFVKRINYEKGPYYANVGNYGSAGSAHLVFLNTLPRNFAQVEGGWFGYGRTVFGVSRGLGSGSLLYGGEAYHDNGPWKHPDNYYKFNGLMTYSQGGDTDGFGITARGYHGAWHSSDQIAANAVPLVGFFGTLNPTDGGNSQRYSLQGEWHRQGTSSQTMLMGYGFYYDLDLFSDFTYYLTDHVRGDQFEQKDNRWVAGLDLQHTFFHRWRGREMANTFGVQGRNDWIHNGLYQTEDRERVEKTDFPAGTTLPLVTEADRFSDTQLGFYAENRVRWSEKFRSDAAMRGDLEYFDVTSLATPANTGAAGKLLPSPKLSLVFGPWSKTEYYIEGGFSFHSNDGRGATQTVQPVSAANPYPNTPVAPIPPLVPTKGAEVGARTVALLHLQSTLSIWYLHSASELQQDGDTGGTVASPQPSNRYGVEWANYYTPREHLAIDFDFADSRALFTTIDSADAAPNSPGARWVPEAVGVVVATGVTLHDYKRFSASLRLRNFGPRNLTSDAIFRSRATMLINTQLGYQINKKWRLAVESLNLLDRYDHDIDYAYESQITPTAAPAFTDVFHPVEPFQMRFQLERSF